MATTRRGNMQKTRKMKGGLLAALEGSRRSRVLELPENRFRRHRRMGGRTYGRCVVIIHHTH